MLFPTVLLKSIMIFSVMAQGLTRKQPSTRLVAWAVVIAGSDPQQPHFPVAWGGVPGQHQTVIRAELFAFVSSLLFGHEQMKCHGATFAIWSDCETHHTQS